MNHQFQLRKKLDHSSNGVAKGKAILVKGKTKPERILPIIDEGRDVTPKPLNPDICIEGKERQLGAVSVSGTGDWQENFSYSGFSEFSGTRAPQHYFQPYLSTFQFRSDLEKQSIDECVQYKGSLKSLSVAGSSYVDFFLDSSSERSAEDSLLNTIHINSEEEIDESKSSIMMNIPTHISLILSETNTHFVLDIPSSTAIKDTDEGMIAELQNEQYEYLTIGKGRNRRLVQAEVQTVPILRKTHSTDAPKVETRPNYAYASLWEMYDTFQETEYEKEEETDKSDLSETEDKRPDDKGSSKSYRLLPDEKQLSELVKNPRFLEAVCVMERLLANNVYNMQQKIFRGLCEPDDFRENIEYKYNLNLLWTFANGNTKGTCQNIDSNRHIRPRATEVFGKSVNALHWNPKNKDLLAVGYGKFYFTDTIPGLVLIWNIKNPVQPERQYSFEESVSSLSFSNKNPNLLAVGFYNGYVAVLNVSSRDTLIVGDNKPTFEPVWHLSWQADWFDHSSEELVCATFDDGRIVVYNLDRKLQGQQIMRVAKSDGVLKGYKSMRKCTSLTIPVSQYASANILEPHPVHKHTYLVGTNEGVIHKCSTSYFNQHLDSFSAHDGPITTIKYSPFSKKIFVTSADDWNVRFWAEDIYEPIMEGIMSMLSVQGLEWSPAYSTLLASIRGHYILLFDLQRKSHRPQSVTPSPTKSRNTVHNFTDSGRCLIVGDIDGHVHMFSLESLPFRPFFQENLLFESLFKILTTNPALLKKLKQVRRTTFQKQNEETV